MIALFEYFVLNWYSTFFGALVTVSLSVAHSLRQNSLPFSFLSITDIIAMECVETRIYARGKRKRKRIDRSSKYMSEIFGCIFAMHPKRCAVKNILYWNWSLFKFLCWIFNTGSSVNFNIIWLRYLNILY